MKLYMYMSVLFIFIVMDGASTKDEPQVEPFIFPPRVKVGRKTSATCIVVGASKPWNFKWLRNGVDLSKMQNIRIENSDEHSTIFIEPVDEKSGGNYTCVVSGKSGRFSYSSHLDVEAPPEWAIQPPSTVSTSVGGTVNISCSVTGLPAPAITWKKRNGDTELSVSSDTLLHLSQTTVNLLIKDVTHEDAGIYTCVAGNGIEPKIETNSNLIVREEPQVQPFIFPPKVKIGRKTSATCTIVGGAKPWTFEWLRNGLSVKGMSNIRVKMDEYDQLSVIFIEPVDERSAGNYTCVVSGRLGKFTYTSYLNVEAPPEWLLKPEPEVTSHLGGVVNISCSAVGSPVPKVTWKKLTEQGRTIVSNEFLSIFSPTFVNLLLKDVTSDMAGKYYCEGVNGIGSNIEASTNIFIRGKNAQE